MPIEYSYEFVKCSKCGKIGVFDKCGSRGMDIDKWEIDKGNDIVLCDICKSKYSRLIPLDMKKIKEDLEWFNSLEDARGAGISAGSVDTIMAADEYSPIDTISYIKEARDFLISEDEQLNMVRKGLDEISENMDKFIQKLEDMIEEEREKTAEYVSTGYDELYCDFGSCSNCGYEMPFGSEYCPYCGAKIVRRR